MKLTQKIIDQIQEAMLHTNLKGEPLVMAKYDLTPYGIYDDE